MIPRHLKFPLIYLPFRAIKLCESSSSARLLSSGLSFTPSTKSGVRNSSVFCTLRTLFKSPYLSHFIELMLPLFSYTYALFCTLKHYTLFLFNRFRTLCTKTPGWGAHPFQQRISPPQNCSFRTFHRRRGTPVGALATSIPSTASTLFSVATGQACILQTEGSRLRFAFSRQSPLVSCQFLPYNPPRFTEIS